MNEYKKIFMLDSKSKNYGIILVDPTYFKKQKDYTDLTIYILDIVSKALLLSQKHNKNNFDVIIHGRGLKIGQMDVSFIKYLTNLLYEYFPQKLRNCYIINSSNIMRNLVHIIKSFLNKDTREKIHLIKNTSMNTNTIDSSKILE